ncbi:MAG: hypothetical protein AB7U23_12670 [Dehalococcoidia bacterium]
MDFVTVIPVRKGRFRTDWEGVAADCKANRGKWGCVGEFSVSYASQIRQGAIAAFLPANHAQQSESEKVAWMKRHWEIEYRRVEGRPPNRADLYIRYIG